MTKRLSVLFATIGALLVLSTSPAAVGMESNSPAIFPAFYEGGVRQVLMSPASNSQDPNQAHAACYPIGPDFSDTSRSADVPVLYALFVPGATQMSCADGTRVHDMVLTAVPGDEGYNAAVLLTRCLAGPNFSLADMPYDSAGKVEAGIAAGELVCTPIRVALSPVVG
jgi:hypothetical protein